MKRETELVTSQNELEEEKKQASEICDTTKSHEAEVMKIQ